MASAHVILKEIRQRLRVAVSQSGRKVVTHNSKRDLPLALTFVSQDLDCEWSQ